MLSSREFFVFTLLALFSPTLSAGSRPCVTADEAMKMMNKDVCITAHVYEVVELPDGTQFLDICTPDTPDDGCRFTIVSFFNDRDLVGELLKYRNMNVRVRGIVRSIHGRAGIVVSHARQFYGGPPKFRPNPRLVRGFGGEQARAPLFDPNLHTQGRGRSFMNFKDRERLPKK
jgi:hypothetical protein